MFGEFLLLGRREQIHQYSMGAAYPNPFKTSVRVDYELKEQQTVEIKIYDIAGRLVHTLFKGSIGAGPNYFEWDGYTDSGRIASSGVYFVRLKAGEFEASRKFILLR